MKLGSHNNNRVLVVDDQKEIHNDFIDMLAPVPTGKASDALADSFLTQEDHDFLPEFELLHASSGMEACEVVKTARQSNRPIAVAFVDIRMPPGIDGVETVRRIRTLDSAIEVVLMTAYADKPLSEVIKGMELLNKLLYIRKPFAHEEIQQIVLSLVEKWNVEQELASRQEQLVASHQRLEAVFDAAGDAMAMYDAAGHLVFANQGYEELLGLKESNLKEIPPDALADRLKERFREPSFPELESKFIFGDQGKLLETTSSGQMPKQRLFYRSVSPVHEGQKDVIGNLVVYRDVSKELEIEQMKAEVLRLRTELETTYSFAGMVGSSPKMRQVYTLMKQAAESDVTVLICGESGTGKEMVAKSFHCNSVRQDGPFLPVNCAAIPESMIESELFGHERGAFTGAVKKRIGAFESARGGTLFLDEITDMPPAMQAKLLRVLQERVVQRLGSSVSHPIDVRFIAASNKDLATAVREGRFRQDLFYRLSVFPIMLPPLRERREDIPMLAEHFRKKHTKRIGKSIKAFSKSALRLLLQYDWPGNVRELENAIERAIVLEQSEVLQANNLPPELSPVVAARTPYPKPAAILPLEEVERQAVAQALEALDHNVVKAARALGIGRATLYRKLQKYGMPSN